MLRRRWGYDCFRPLQREAVDAALAGRDSLVVLPTGGGKSLCYQLPAVCGRGLVLVVSPLIALMDDQVAAAEEVGIAAGALHSQAIESRRRQTWARLMAGDLQLLYVSPERLVVATWFDDLAGRVGLVAVDEAHCVSHWGHEFRPEYRQLGALFDRHPRIPRMALTATATPQVQADIVQQLGLRDPLVLIGHPDRANLIYRAFPRHDQSRQVLEVIRRHPGEGGIVYAQTRREVERLAKTLATAGVSCAPYHAGLDAAVRARVQDDFVNERLDVVVATIAFGMGIDRSNVRYVIHANAPRSIEHYQQESGRAGRDGGSAECVLLFAAGDLATHRLLATRDGQVTPERRRVIEAQVRDIGRFAVAPVCRHRLLAEHFGQPWPPPQTDARAGIIDRPSEAADQDVTAAAGCAACDVCLGETEALPDAEARLVAQKILSAVYRTGNRFGAAYVCKVLLGRPDERITANGHDGLRVFGLMADSHENHLRAWIDQLIVQGLLAVSDGEYPVLQLTPNGLSLCRGDGVVRLGRPAAPAAKKERRSRKARTAAEETLGAADQSLFERLRSLRRSLARRQHVPPYVIFHDSVLTSLAVLRPADLEGLGAIKGIGERKLARYGALILAVMAGEDPEALVSRLPAE